MLVTEPTIAEIQSDHQHWLREIERWEGRLGLWDNEQALLVREVTRLQQLVHKHGAELEEHAAALKALKEVIAAAERSAVTQRGEVDRSLAQVHAKTETSHAAQRDLHERLKRMHHTLVAQLSMLQHEPIRDE